MNIFYYIPSIKGFNIHVKPFLDFSKGNHFVIYNYGDERKYIYNGLQFINLFKCNNYGSLLSRQKIDYFILFNISSIMDIFFIQLCKSLQIKTIYVQHGLRINYNNISPDKIFKKRSSFFYLINRAFKKYLRYFLYYLKHFYIFKNKNIIFGYLCLYIKNINKPVILTIPTKGYKNISVTDYAFVYSQYDSNYLINFFNYKKDLIFIMGLPLNAPSEKQTIKKQKTILLITNDLKNDGLISKEVEKQLFIKIYKYFNEGYDFIIKLHPNENEDDIKGYFEKIKSPKILRDVNPLELINSADLVLCFFSSTMLLNVIKDKKPFAFIQIPGIEFEYQDAFGITQYGIGKRLNMSGLISTNIVEQLFEVNNEKYNNFIQKFIGPVNYNHPTYILEKLSEFK